MAAPAGYSSDEYDGSDYDFDYYSHNTDNTENKISPEDHRANKLLQLSQFAMSGYTEAVIKILDEESLPVNIKLHDNWTPLSLAASNCNLELCKVLISRGADLNETRDTQTLLMLACNIATYNANFDKVKDLVEYLIEQGVDANAQNKKRMTAFLFAASSGNAEVVEYLKPYCDIHAVDNQGWNALFWAVNDNHIGTVKLLLHYGLDYKKIDIRRCTALDYARQHGFSRIVDLFPNSKSQEDYDSVVIGSHYDYNEEINNPRFMRDICAMLVSMNCRPFLNTFIDDPTMNLFKFLTLDKRDLWKMGIIKPYQQNRILGGLYRFHKHPYQYKSIPIKGRNDIMTTDDIAMSIMAALRHFETMRASLRYLFKNMDQSEYDDEMKRLLIGIKLKLEQAERVVNVLQRKAKKWDKLNRRVDLITPKMYETSTKGAKIIFAVPILTALSIVLYFKFKM